MMETARCKDAGRKVIELLTRQSLLYRELRSLAVRQTELVTGEDPETLLKVLANRQRLINRLSAIDAELEPIRADWERVAATLSNEQRHEVQRLVGEVQAVLGEILSRDARDTESLNRQKQQVSGQIRAAAEGRRLNRAYAMCQGQRARPIVDTCSD